jgi:RNA polymerase sigma-70 factor (ECF subfamily)
MDIAELLQRVRRGDATAAQELVQSYHSEIFRLALSILNDPADAEDITQDVFISAIHALDSYRGDSAFKTWLFSITVNVCRRRWKQRKTRERLIQVLQSIFPLIGAGSVHPEDVLIRRENRAELWKAVNGLNEKYRLPLTLFYGHELPVAEIAQVLNIPVGTVLSRLHTARERLAAKLHTETDIHYEVSEP